MDETDQSADALPAATPVTRAHTSFSGWSRGRKILAIGSTVGGVGMIIFGLLTSGSGGVTPARGPVTTYADVQTSDGDDRIPAGERITVDRSDSGDTNGTNDLATPAPDSAVPPASDADGPADPGATPGTTDPVGTNPGAPATSVPGTIAPPAPAPAPAPAPGPAPAQPQPLAFAGLTKNQAGGLVGIGVLSSYTLSLIGQPGATASVTYGGANAGPVTFDLAGLASITLGGSLLDLGISNPIIRVGYSDGTAGVAIEAARDSL